MSSNLSLTAQGSDDAKYHPASSPIDPRPPPTPLISHDTPRRSSIARAATEPRLGGIDDPSNPLPRSTASSSGEAGTNISRRSASTPSNNSKAKGRKDAVSKEITREPGNSRDSIVIKESRDHRANGRIAHPAPLPTAIDPLSHYIFTRANTERSIASRLLNPTRPESPANESLARTNADTSNKRSALHPDSARDKKKGVSLLSRLSMLGSKKSADILEDEAELSDQRTEGANAIAFSSAVYIPHHKEPPRYIHVRAQHKKTKEFNRIFLAQELVGTRPSLSTGGRVPPDGDAPPEPPNKAGSTSGGPIWAVVFSQDGRFLATGGRDRVLRVWAVIATEEERRAYDDEESANADKEARLSAPAFHSKPAREFIGHEGDILDLSWSKNNFLLSSSMDKTVRLWHMSRRECLCTFKHKDFVASIAFHPRDDRFFLAGSLDSTLRLWSIPDKAVAYSSQLSDIATAVGFSPDGKTAIAGCFHGLCVFFETEGLKYLSQIHVRSSRGRNAKGSKITGLQTINASPDDPDSEVKLLVTSNDSRIRIYNLADQTLEAKFKGHENACSQIRATFSDDGAYVICGSEDRKAFIWPRGMAASEGRDRRACEHFEAHSGLVTAAIFAPTKTRRLLQASQDPIFTLCNPPPITLRSMEEMTANQAPSTYDAQSETSAKTKKPEESPAFIARSAHRGGNIIVTTDNFGLIKVFRQDCAFAKRRHENWETGSSFSKKLGRDKLLGRTASIITGTSVSSRDPNSRRGSISQPLHITSDRIDTWRRGVEGNPGRPLSFTVTAPTPTATAPASARSDRSPSPNKATHQPLPPISPTRANATFPVISPASPAASIRSSRTNEAPQRGETSVPLTPSLTIRSADDDLNNTSDSATATSSFWHLDKWRTMGLTRGNAHDSTKTSPLSKEVQTGGAARQVEGAMSAAERFKSRGSRPTEQAWEKSSADRRWSSNTSRLRPSPLEERDENEDFLAPPSHAPTSRTASLRSRLSSEMMTSEDGEEMECVKCGNRDFRAKRVGGVQRLLCGNCGRMVEV
ncbi:WD40 repeat-like protein [Xylaria intraflava]|nr:WD40 repeat-like protein [Xylaria intraflava]